MNYLECQASFRFIAPYNESATQQWSEKKTKIKRKNILNKSNSISKSTTQFEHQIVLFVHVFVVVKFFPSNLLFSRWRRSEFMKTSQMHRSAYFSWNMKQEKNNSQTKVIQWRNSPKWWEKESESEVEWIQIEWVKQTKKEKEWKHLWNRRKIQDTEAKVEKKFASTISIACEHEWRWKL